MFRRDPPGLKRPVRSRRNRPKDRPPAGGRCLRLFYAAGGVYAGCSIKVDSAFPNPPPGTGPQKQNRPGSPRESLIPPPGPIRNTICASAPTRPLPILLAASSVFRPSGRRRRRAAPTVGSPDQRLTPPGVPVRRNAQGSYLTILIGNASSCQPSAPRVLLAPRASRRRPLFRPLPCEGRGAYARTFDVFPKKRARGSRRKARGACGLSSIRLSPCSPWISCFRFPLRPSADLGVSAVSLSSVPRPSSSVLRPPSFVLRPPSPVLRPPSSVNVKIC